MLLILWIVMTGWLLALPELIAQPVEVETDWDRLEASIDRHWIAGSETIPDELNVLLREDASRVRRIAWGSYRSAPIHDSLKTDYEADRVRWKEHESPYTVKEVGERPAGGWPLFIALHGGGGVAKEVNDAQWKGMQRYYRAHPELGGYLYLALRAPNDRWNGFYDLYVYPLVENLVRQFLLYGDVDPDKVFLMGYSHGGYGAFAIGMKIPHRFAAVHASAAAPTEGEGAVVNLRNTVFTCMVGEKDTAYGRKERCEVFALEVAKLRGDREDIFPVTVQVIEGRGHGGLPDRDQIVPMYAAGRDASPRELSWELTDDLLSGHFWIHASEPAAGGRIEARCRDNRLTISSSGVKHFTLGLDERLVDLDSPLRITLNGAEAFELTVAPSVTTLCAWLDRFGDPRLARTVEVSIGTGE